MTGEGESSRSRSLGRLWLALGVLLALGATLALVLAEDLRWLRLGTVAALWAALMAAFLAMRYRRQAATTEESAAKAQQVYELELEREIAARREFELEIEAESRQQVDDESREELYALRDEITALRENLKSLFGGELMWERIALTAQAARLRSPADEPKMVAAGEAVAASPQLNGGPSKADPAATEFLSRVREPVKGQDVRPVPERSTRAEPNGTSYGPRRVRPAEDGRPPQRPVNYPFEDSRPAQPHVGYRGEESRPAPAPAGYAGVGHGVAGRPPDRRRDDSGPMPRPAERHPERPAERSAEQPPGRPAAPPPAPEPQTRRVPAVADQVGSPPAPARPRGGEPRAEQTRSTPPPQGPRFPEQRPSQYPPDTPPQPTRPGLRPQEAAGEQPEPATRNPTLPVQIQDLPKRQGGRRYRPEGEDAPTSSWQPFGAAGDQPAATPTGPNGGNRPHGSNGSHGSNGTNGSHGSPSAGGDTTSFRTTDAIPVRDNGVRGVGGAANGSHGSHGTANGSHGAANGSPGAANGSNSSNGGAAEAGGRRRAPEPEDDGGGAHAEGRSVSELLAAYGTGESAPRRRRRAED